jgi:nucleoside-diphosphate-sugar epimerase
MRPRSCLPIRERRRNQAARSSLNSCGEHSATDKQPPLVNISGGEELTIAELAWRIRQVVGARADIVYDRSKPDGTPQKLLDIGLLRSLGWKPHIPMSQGVPATQHS